MSWLSKLFGSAEKKELANCPALAPSQPEMTTYQKAIFEQASGLMHVVNESLQISNNSKNPETKVSRLEVARSKLDSLELLSQQNPFLTLQRLDGVRKTISELSTEFSEAGYYALTDQSCRDYQQDVWKQINMPVDDIIKGFVFCATMQLRTPLRVLSRHLEIHKGLTDPPLIAKMMWEGIWSPDLKSLKELTGLDLADFKPSEMASDIGPIPSDGGDYLKFLLKVRAIVEQHSPIESRKRALSDELKHPRWIEFVRKLGGEQAIHNRFFPAFIGCIRGLPSDSIEAMWSAKLTTPASLSSASDATLKAFKGIGPAKLKSIRDVCMAATDKQSEFLDNVSR